MRAAALDSAHPARQPRGMASTPAARPALSRRRAAALAALILASAAGAAEPRSPATRALPGFSVDLPEGEVVEESHGYASGRLVLKTLGSPSVVAVTWQAGGIAREHLELTARALASYYGVAGAGTIVALAGPGGTPVETVAVDSALRREVVAPPPEREGVIHRLAHRDDPGRGRRAGCAGQSHARRPQGRVRLRNPRRGARRRPGAHSGMP